MVRKKETKTRGETREEFKSRAKKAVKLEQEKSSLDNLKSESDSEEQQFEIEEILDSKTKK